jgi:hypothetical protein
MGKSYGDLQKLIERAETELHECAGLPFRQAFILAFRGVTEPLADHIAEGKLSKTDLLLLANFIADLPQKQPVGHPPGAMVPGAEEIAEQIWRRKQIYKAETGRGNVPRSQTEQFIKDELDRLKNETGQTIAPEIVWQILHTGRFRKSAQKTHR